MQMKPLSLFRGLWRGTDKAGIALGAVSTPRAVWAAREVEEPGVVGVTP